MSTFLKQWVEQNIGLVDESLKSQPKDFEKEKVKYLNKGETEIIFSDMISDITSNEFKWPTGKSSIRWFYHFADFALLIPNSVHWNIISLQKKFGDKILGVIVMAEGEGKQRRYPNIIPLLKED